MDDILDCVKRAQNGDEDAKKTLLENNSPLIKSVIRHYKNKGVEYDDLYQLGCVGFLKAVKNFSAEFGVKFSTYAVPMIAGEVKRFLRDDGSIKVARSTKTLAAKISRFVEDYKNSHDAAPSVDVISAEFGIEPYETVFAMDSAKSPLSLYEKSDDESTLTLMDKVADKVSVDDNIDRIIIKDFIGGLDERDKKIIILRYYKDKTQSEVARVLKVSQVQVSRLEKKILDRIREEFI